MPEFRFWLAGRSESRNGCMVLGNNVQGVSASMTAPITLLDCGGCTIVGHAKDNAAVLPDIGDNILVGVNNVAHTVGPEVSKAMHAIRDARQASAHLNAFNFSRRIAGLVSSFWISCLERYILRGLLCLENTATTLFVALEVKSDASVLSTQYVDWSEFIRSKPFFVCFAATDPGISILLTLQMFNLDLTIHLAYRSIMEQQLKNGENSEYYETNTHLAFDRTRIRNRFSYNN